jgi:hypothetical protein
MVYWSKESPQESIWSAIPNVGPNKALCDIKGKRRASLQDFYDLGKKSVGLAD